MPAAAPAAGSSFHDNWLCFVSVSTGSGDASSSENRLFKKKKKKPTHKQQQTGSGRFLPVMTLPGPGSRAAPGPGAETWPGPGAAPWPRGRFGSGHDCNLHRWNYQKAVGCKKKRNQQQQKKTKQLKLKDYYTVYTVGFLKVSVSSWLMSRKEKRNSKKFKSEKPRKHRVRQR